VKTKLAAAALALLIMGGCASKTEHGECIGINDKENPKLEYKYSARNIAIGVIFIELVAPPIIVVLNELRCPVGPKEATQ
jgi:hypothetical protein